MTSRQCIPRTSRLLALLAATAIVASACGADISDSIVLPEGFTTTTDQPGEASEPAVTSTAPEETTATTTAPETTEPQPETTSTTTEPPNTISPDITVPAAVSESGRNPAYGGGNPSIPLVEALSVTMPSVTGGEVDLSQYLGQDVVLWFWAPWCSWCNAEAPRVNAMVNEFGDDVEVIGVAGVSDIEEMQEFVARHGLEHVTHVADFDSRFWLSLDVTYQPWWMFINDTGEVVLNWQGRLSEDDIREVMDILVAA